MALADDRSLAPRHLDHDLSGDWEGYRECYVKPDLLLVYRKSDALPYVWPGLARTASFSVETAITLSHPQS
ncbi:hypothetical protein SBDP1_430008 [Syntrophobacter sp. SbD1]|nr:hypothetical protein SBDP1_430008 [Syntrophobacter sp. SbD1]